MKVLSVQNGIKTLLIRSTLLVCALFLALALRAYFAFMPDKMVDVGEYLVWSKRIAEIGINASYFGDFKKVIDYPPIFPYILGLVGSLYKRFDFSLLGRWGSSYSFMIIFPAITADILTSLLIFLFLKKKVNFKIAYSVMLTYAFNPAIIFDTAYWGQSDAIHSLFVLLSIICLVHKKPELSWVLITLGVFTKPLALPFIPLIVFLTLIDYRRRRLLSCIFISLIVSLVILSPFIYHRRLIDILMKMISDLHAMPYISVNAHNIWWLISLGPPRVPAANRLCNIFSYTDIAISLFSLFYFFVLFRLWNLKNSESIYLSSAAIAFGFFMLSTYMHENHMFSLFPLLAMVYFRDRHLSRLYIFLSLTFLANMILHDYNIITHSIYKISYHIERLGYFAPTPQGSMCLLHRVLTLFNALINTILFEYFIFYLIKRRSTGETRFIPAYKEMRR